MFVISPIASCLLPLDSVQASARFDETRIWANITALHRKLYETFIGFPNSQRQDHGAKGVAITAMASHGEDVPPASPRMRIKNNQFRRRPSRSGRRPR